MILCRICGQPVVHASFGGMDVCPSCDCGVCRFCGERFSYQELTWENGIRKHVSNCQEIALLATPRLGIAIQDVPQHTDEAILQRAEGLDD